MFISKPGTRWLVSLSAIGLAGWQNEAVIGFVSQPYVLDFLDDWIPLSPEEVELFAIITMAALILTFVILSIAIRVVLGAFPPMRRPLRPLRLLRVKEEIQQPASVSIAVPTLNHQFRSSDQPQMIARLPDGLQTLLAPTEERTEALPAVLTLPDVTDAPEGPQRLRNEPVRPSEDHDPPRPVEVIPPLEGEQGTPRPPPPPKTAAKPKSDDSWKKRLPPRKTKQQQPQPRPDPAAEPEA